MNKAAGLGMGSRDCDTRVILQLNGKETTIEVRKGFQLYIDNDGFSIGPMRSRIEDTLHIEERPDASDDFRAWLKQRTKGHSRSCAKRAGISQPYLSMLQTGKKKRPEMDVVERLIETLEPDADDSRMNEIMGYAGFKNKTT